MVRVAALCGLKSDNKDWFGLAEQAIGAIYALAKHPDEICSEIVRRKTRAVFEGEHLPPPPDPSEDQIMREAGQEMEEPEVPPEAPADASFFPLSQLLFIVGHVASRLAPKIALWSC
jgi:condensin complex subunit 1